MAGDSAVMNIITDLPSGMIDVDLDGVDVTAYVPVYLSGDNKVKPVLADVTQANVKKLLGWARQTVTSASGLKVQVKTRFRVHQKGVAGETLAAGDPVKQESGTGALVNSYKKFVEDTDGEQEYIGMCILGGSDTDDIEVLLF